MPLEDQHHRNESEQGHGGAGAGGADGEAVADVADAEFFAADGAGETLDAADGEGAAAAAGLLGGGLRFGIGHEWFLLGSAHPVSAKSARRQGWGTRGSAFRRSYGQRKSLASRRGFLVFALYIQNIKWSE